jgi:hypothetical protein
MLATMAEADRNEQVRILRALAQTGGEAAVEGFLLGLRSPERRVREVAIKACAPVLHYPSIVAQLATIAQDPDEKPKLRHAALSALCGQTSGRPTAALPSAAATALAPFVESEEHRGHVTLCLARLPLSPDVDGLLRRVIFIGTDEEVALAQRTLAGEKVVNLGEFGDEATRQHIAQTYDLAAGRVFYWVSRS